MNTNVNLSYAAQSVDEFFSIIERLKGMQIVPAVSISKPKADDKGPNELAYIEATGKRFRLTDAEKTAVENGQTTREELAAQRLQEYAPPASSDDVMDGPSLASLQKDDGEELM